jgi:DNA-binding transcriptional ArsR family regulator
MQRSLQALKEPPAPESKALDVDEMLVSAREAAEFLKALAHESRLLILCLLTERERTVGELEQILDIRQSAVSQQLARLRADDLVVARRDGKNIYYAIARPEVVGVVGALYQAFCKR